MGLPHVIKKVKRSAPCRPSRADQAMDGEVVEMSNAASIGTSGIEMCVGIHHHIYDR